MRPAMVKGSVVMPADQSLDIGRILPNHAQPNLAHRRFGRIQLPLDGKLPKPLAPV
jgi:hypothetical protein